MARKADKFFNMQFITSSISTTLVLLLLGMVVFFVLSANNLSDYVRENIGFTVLVSDDMKEAEALKFQQRLNAEAYVKESVYISKEQALKEQTEAMGTDPAEFLGYNPFTASIEIKLNAAYANSDSIAWIEKEILAEKKVMEVSYPQDLLDSVNRNIQRVSLFLIGLAGLLTLISFALINNTVFTGDDNGNIYIENVNEDFSGRYYASVYQTDLGSDSANKSIGNWLNKNTGGMLKDRTDKIDLSPETILSIIVSSFIL